MVVLGIDSSGLTASAALLSKEVVLAEISVHHKKTHSETLLPMVEELFQRTGLTPQDVDVLAVAAGPGSFTGLRIGAATIKGLGLALDKPVAAVPTLEALAWNAAGAAELVVPMMDARRSEVYAAVYRMPVAGAVAAGRNNTSANGEDSKTKRLLPEEVLPGEALPAAELAEKLNALGEPVLLLGDGVDATREILEATLKIPYRFAPIHQNRQRAASVASLGLLYAEEGRLVSSDDFEPIYLRKSQAERVREENARKA